MFLMACHSTCGPSDWAKTPGRSTGRARSHTAPSDNAVASLQGVGGGCCALAVGRANSLLRARLSRRWIPPIEQVPPIAGAGVRRPPPLTTDYLLFLRSSSALLRFGRRTVIVSTTVVMGFRCAARTVTKRPVRAERPTLIEIRFGMASTYAVAGSRSLPALKLALMPSSVVTNSCSTARHAGGMIGSSTAAFSSGLTV